MKEKIPFSEALKAYYEERNLNKTDVKKFLNLQQTLLNEQKQKNHFMNSRRMLAFTASSSFVFLCLLIFQSYYFYSDSHSDEIQKRVLFANLIKQNLINELTTNYNKQLNPEVRYSAFEETKKHFSKLDFTPVKMERFKDSDSWKLIGARYETINGSLGVICTFFSKKFNTYVSVFQSAQPQGLSDIKKPIQALKNGVKIRYWTEKGVLVGIAE